MTTKHMKKDSSIETLVSALESRTPWTDDRIASLEDRKKEEIDFHNFEREQNDEEVVARQAEENVHANKKWYKITRKSRTYVDWWIRKNSKNKVVLDYACGTGTNAIKAAKSGATMAIGLDISDVSVEIAKKKALEEGVADNTIFIQGDCEATELPDNSIDTVICCGMRHHLDLECAYNELLRILRPGGKILCVEALANNPVIQWYRNTTPNMRTEWETHHVLRFDTLKYSQKWFRLGEVRFWHLSTIPAALIPFALGRNAIIAVGNLVDSAILRIPFIQRMAWQFTFELVHPEPKNSHGSGHEK